MAVRPGPRRLRPTLPQCLFLLASGAPFKNPQRWVPYSSLSSPDSPVPHAAGMPKPIRALGQSARSFASSASSSLSRPAGMGTRIVTTGPG